MPEREIRPGAEAVDAPSPKAPPPGRAEGPAGALLRVEDTTGRRLGSGFLADDRGTVVTAYEAVRDAAELLVSRADGAGLAGPVRIGADAVTSLPGSGLAPLRAPGLVAVPLPVAAGRRHAAHTSWWRRGLAAGPGAGPGAVRRGRGRRGARGRPRTGHRHRRPQRRPARRWGGGRAGARRRDRAGPRGPHPALEVGRQGCFAVPLRAAVRDAPDGALAALLARNEATVPGLGAGLNLAGALQLTATTVGSEGPQSPTAPPVERPGTAAELAAFEDGPCLVLGLVGAPGTGRTTELAALAARRAAGSSPAPTVWLRGADLLPDDLDVGDAVRRALARAARIVEAAGGTAPDWAAPHEDASPEEVARLARRAGRPLVLLLDGPEEMPPALAHRLSAWTTGTAAWLARTGAKLVVGCRPEYWEQVCGLFPGALRHRPAGPQPGRPVTDCVSLGDLPEDAAAKARARYGLADGLLAERHARHPLTLRLLADVRRALPPGVPDLAERLVPGEDGSALPLDRDAVFSAYLDLMCLRTAVRLAAPHGLRGTALRRVAARVAGQLHEAARRCLGPGQGELDRESFESLFPWGTGGGRLGELPGCASAVLTEGLIIPAGAGYRFAHEELGDWLQGAHLDVDAALAALVHRWRVGVLPRGLGPPVVRGVGLRGRGGGGGAGCGDRGWGDGAPVAGVGYGGAEAGSGLGPGDGSEETALPRATVRRRRRMAEREAAEAGRRGSVGTRRGVEGASPHGASELRDGAAGQGGDGAEESAGGAGWRGADMAAAHPAPAESGLNVAHGAGRAAPYGAADQRDPAAQAAPHAGRGAAPGGAPTVPRALPVPRHRIGPVVEALLHLARNRGADELSRRLAGLIEAADEFLTSGESPTEPKARVTRQQGSPDRERATRAVDDSVEGGEAGVGGRADGPVPPGGRSGTGASRPTAEHVAEPLAPSAAASSAPHSKPPRTGRATWEDVATPRARAAVPRRLDGAGAAPDPRPALAPWWAVRLLGETLLRLPDCRPYLGVLRVLAGWIVERARERGCRRISGRGSGRRSRCPPRTGPICCGGSWWRTARAATTGSWLPPGSSWWPTPGPRSRCCAPGSATTGGCRPCPRRPSPRPLRPSCTRTARATPTPSSTHWSPTDTSAPTNCSPPSQRRTPAPSAAAWPAGPSTRAPHAASPPSPTACGPPRTPRPRPTANCSGSPPRRCSPAPPTPPCTAGRWPCSSATRSAAGGTSSRRPRGSPPSRTRS
ncbi:serine protease [Streptomyces sp. AD16]|nr:serine protease [Streptomyces sp. AD16]